jgi:hypothetical protein
MSGKEIKEAGELLNCLPEKYDQMTAGCQAYHVVRGHSRRRR